MKQLDFETDLGFLTNVLRGEYEKANFWNGYTSIDEADFVLDEEVEEAGIELEKIYRILFDENGDRNLLSKEQLGNIRGYALRLMCEGVQMVAVCNKYEQMHDRNEVLKNETM